MVKRENPLQSGRSQRYVIANAHQISHLPGGLDHVVNLSAPQCIAVSAGSGALFPPSAPTRVQLAVGVASRLWRTGQSESARPVWPPASSRPALPLFIVCRILVHEDVAMVVRRASPAGLTPAGGWHPLCGRREYAHGQTGLQASGGPENTAQPVPFLCLRLSDRPPHGPVGCLSHPGGCRPDSTDRRYRRPHRKRFVSPYAAGVSVPDVVPAGRGHSRCGLRLAGQSRHDPGAGILVHHGAASGMGICPWQSRQRPGDASAAREVSPDSHAYRQYTTPPNHLSLCQTRAAAPFGTRHRGGQQISAQRWAETDQNPGDQSARAGDRTGDCWGIPAQVVDRAADEGTQRRRGDGAALDHQTGRSGGTLGGRGDHGLSAAAQAACQEHHGRPPVERVSPATGLSLGGDPGTV